ncbi:MAG: HD family hydrolase [Anaerolineae bacterium]|nr:HD family hydrolase [Anaerolineae bacterium]
MNTVETDSVLKFLLRANQLKCVLRTGWVMRGVTGAESVADHSFGVAFISLVLAEMMEQPLDKAKLLTIALLHDLPESVIGDLPTPAAAYFPAGAKQKAEVQVLSELLCQLPHAEQWHAWWQEFEDGASVEGRLVRDADRLDMLIQAHVYEQTTGNRHLEEFWAKSDTCSFESTAAQTLYEELMALRERLSAKRLWSRLSSLSEQRTGKSAPLLYQKLA